MDLTALVTGRWPYLFTIVLLLIGLYGMMVKQNMMKKVFGLNIFQGAIILFFIVHAYKHGATVGRGGEEAATLAEITIERARMAVPTLQVGNASAGHSQRLAGYLVAHSQFASTLGRRNAWSSVLASDPCT